MGCIENASTILQTTFDSRIAYFLVMPLREIVTVQLGEYSNFVGAHFWNIQDEALAQSPTCEVAELSPAVLFSEQFSTNPVLPYAPRLQIIDLNGAFGSLSLGAGVSLRPELKPNAMNLQSTDDSRSASHALWHGKSDVYVRNEVPRNKYLMSLDDEDSDGKRMSNDATAPGVQREASQTSDAHLSNRTLTCDQESTTANGTSEHFDLDGTVQYWSDYLKVRLHPRTSSAIPGLHAGVHDFTMSQTGVAAMTIPIMDELYDRLRFFIEECDCLGGLLLNCDAFGGFSGVGAQYLSHVRDELGSSPPIAIFGTASATSTCTGLSALATRDRMFNGMYNQAYLVSAAIEFGAQYVPLHADATQSMPFMHPSASNKFQSSAALGLAMDVSLSCLRHKAQRLSLSSLLAALRPAPFAMYSGVGLSVPVVRPVEFRRSCMLEVESMRSLSLSPGARLDSRTVQRRFSKHSTSKKMPQSFVTELVSGRGVAGNFDAICNTTAPIAIPVPFPRVFDPRIAMDGTLLSRDAACSRLPLCEVAEVSALSSMYADPTSAASELNKLADSMGQSHRTGCRDGQVEAAALEISETLRAIACDYETL